MVQLEQLRNSIFTFILIFTAGCSTPASPVLPEPLKVINFDSGKFSNQNGIISLNNKLFSGTAFGLFPGSNDTAFITRYLNGKEHGDWIKFYSKGILKEKRHFENGTKAGEYNTWWENGKMQQQYFFKNDEYEGICKEWNGNGILIRSMQYRRGHEEGQQQQFYDNGKIRSNYFIINGRRYGLLGTKNCVNVSDSTFNRR